MSGDGIQEKIQKTELGQDARDLQQKLQTEAATGLNIRNTRAETQVGACSLKEFPVVNSVDGAFLFLGIKGDGTSAQCINVGIGYSENRTGGYFSKTHTRVTDPTKGTRSETDTYGGSFYTGKKN